jgi:hypothetical protein
VIGAKTGLRSVLALQGLDDAPVLRVIADSIEGLVAGPGLLHVPRCEVEEERPVGGLGVAVGTLPGFRLAWPHPLASTCCCHVGPAGPRPVTVRAGRPRHALAGRPGLRPGVR